MGFSLHIQPTKSPRYAFPNCFRVVFSSHVACSLSSIALSSTALLNRRGFRSGRCGLAPMTAPDSTTISAIPNPSQVRQISEVPELDRIRARREADGDL